MKVSKFRDGSSVRYVLSAMIYDSLVLARISSQWDQEGLFNNQWADTVGTWCVSFMRKYNKAPGDRIYRKFEIWSEKTNQPEDVIDHIESFLRQVDRSEYSNSDHVLDVASELFEKIRIEKEIAAAKIDIEQGRITEARGRLDHMKRINLGIGSYIEPANDPEIWASSLERSRERPLITYPGALGDRLIQDSFARGSLYAFTASDKIGKTTYLIDAAYRACRKRCKVAFFDVGDSVQEEVMLKLAMRSTQKPEIDKLVNIPIGWNEEGELDFEDFRRDSVDPVSGFRMFRKIVKSPDSLRIACYENSSIDVSGIDSVLANWDREGWVPDVVIVDYADILAPPRGVKDPLDQIDATWKQLRGLSQRRHCLILTATQANAQAYGKEGGLLSKKNFSGRKTKNAHVNGIIGINVSSQDKEIGCSRLNWVVRRKGRYNERFFVTVAGCWEIGCPIIISKAM